MTTGDRKRLLFLNNQGLAALGGGPSIVRHLVSGLADSYAITVASQDDEAPGWPGVAQRRIPAPPAPGRLWRIAPLHRAWSLRRALPPDCSHADLVVALDVHAGPALAHRRPARLLYHSLSSIPRQERAMGMSRSGILQYAWLERLLARRAHAVLASSHAHAADLARSSGRRADVLYPALPDPHPLPSPPPGPITILAAGRMVPGKRFETVLDQAHRLSDLQCQFVLAGDGPSRPALEAQVAALGLANRVRFAGAVPDLRPLLAEAHLLLHPSPYESFGMVLFEAIQAGRPVLCDPNAGAGEILPPSFICPMADAGQLETRLRQLITNQPQRTAAAALARQAAETALRHPYLDGFRALVERLLSTPDPSP